MDDAQILQQINSLVEEEHALRSGSSPDSARLKQLEESLDQCWDLLRRREAARDAGTNPDDAKPLPVEQVENYLQ